MKAVETYFSHILDLLGLVDDLDRGGLEKWRSATRCMITTKVLLAHNIKLDADYDQVWALLVEHDPEMFDDQGFVMYSESMKMVKQKDDVKVTDWAEVKRVACQMRVQAGAQAADWARGQKEMMANVEAAHKKENAAAVKHYRKEFKKFEAFEKDANIRIKKLHGHLVDCGEMAEVGMKERSWSRRRRS